MLSKREKQIAHDAFMDCECGVFESVYAAVEAVLAQRTEPKQEQLSSEETSWAKQNHLRMYADAGLLEPDINLAAESDGPVAPAQEQDVADEELKGETVILTKYVRCRETAIGACLQGQANDGYRLTAAVQLDDAEFRNVYITFGLFFEKEQHPPQQADGKEQS